jgi:phospholipase/lecithinase/hemolysin
MPAMLWFGAALPRRPFVCRAAVAVRSQGEGMIRTQKWTLAVALSALLAACGGSDGGDTTPRQSVTSVKVFGDSLADVGTFGIKFTVQGAGHLIYPERVAQTYGLSTGCNFFVFTGTTFAANPTAGCKNYAIGGGVINGAGSGLAASDPRVVGVQLATAVAAGNYASGDLLIIDGGGNDAAALVGAYLKAATDGGASYVALLGTQLSAAQVGAAVAGGASGLAAAGKTYMQALADTFYGQIKAQALDKGAQRVVVLNMPGITNTPRFQMVLDSIAASAGGGATGAGARAQYETLFKGWVEGFNAELALKFSGNASVVVVDFYTAFNDQVTMPAQFSLTNVKTPACPITGLGSDGLPTYTFSTCTATALSAAIPAGATGGADWWKTYAFSDSFHPTPYGHQLLAQLISRALANAGWL